MSRAVEHFQDELGRLIDRMRLEYEVSYAEVVGVLEITKHDLICEASEDDEEE